MLVTLRPADDLLFSGQIADRGSAPAQRLPLELRQGPMALTGTAILAWHLLLEEWLNVILSEI